jgi:hypothetical protein
VLLTIDEVLTRRPQAGHFLELRTARLMMAGGYRYFSGVGLAFLQHLRVVVELALGMLGSLLLIADGARWIRNFFTEMLREVPQKVMILDGITCVSGVWSSAAASGGARRPKRSCCSGSIVDYGVGTSLPRLVCWRRIDARPGTRKSWTN